MELDLNQGRSKAGERSDQSLLSVEEAESDFFLKGKKASKSVSRTSSLKYGSQSAERVEHFQKDYNVPPLFQGSSQPNMVRMSRQASSETSELFSVRREEAKQEL